MAEQLFAKYAVPLIFLKNNGHQGCPPATQISKSKMNHTFFQYSFEKEQNCILAPTTHVTIIMLYNQSAISQASMHGLVTAPRKLHFPKHSTLYCVQMDPLDALVLLGQEALIALLDSSKPLRQVIDLDLSAIETLDPQTDLHQKAGSFEELFAPEQALLPQHCILNNILTCIHNANDKIKVSDLSMQTGYSDRQLYQIFKNNFGIGIKLYSRIMRFQNSLKWLSGVNSDLITLACSLGYYDQAHFMHEFKTLSTLTPLEYQSSQLR